MMYNKILVEIYVPAVNRKFDTYIPIDVKMRDIVVMVSNAISSLSDGKYIANKDSILCNADNGVIFNINIEVAELGIKNGSRLMLI